MLYSSKYKFKKKYFPLEWRDLVAVPTTLLVLLPILYHHHVPWNTAGWQKRYQNRLFNLQWKYISNITDTVDEFKLIWFG